MPARLPEAADCALRVAAARAPKTSAALGLPTVTAPARLLPAALVTSLTVVVEAAIRVVTIPSALTATPAAPVTCVPAQAEPLAPGAIFAAEEAAAIPPLTPA